MFAIDLIIYFLVIMTIGGFLIHLARNHYNCKTITVWMDINNTILFYDPSSGKTFSMMLINLIVESVMGFASGDGPLDWNEDPNGNITYWQHLVKTVGKKTAREYRETAFEEGNPLAGRFDDLSSEPQGNLKVPNECLEIYQKLGINTEDPDGINVHPIIPSFLRTIIKLQNNGDHIKANFTTFGMDIHVLQTWLAFRQGHLDDIVGMRTKTTKQNQMNTAHFRWEDRYGEMIPCLRLWKDIDVAVAVSNYDRMSDGHSGKFEPDFKDLLQTTCDQYVEGIHNIFLALAEVKGDTFINNDYNSWAGSKKRPEMGKIIPDLPYNYAFDDNALECMVAYNPETGEPVENRSRIFVADPRSVFHKDFFGDAIRRLMN
jgi:hypothetical protein